MFQNITERFWLFVRHGSKNESEAWKICVENGLINAIDQFYDASLVGNLRLDLRPVERALWGCDE